MVGAHRARRTASRASGVPLRESLRRFARIYLGSWLVTPELVRVLVREVARSPEVGDRVEEIRGLFVALQRVIEAAGERGELRAGVDPVLAAWVVYGALEEILTGWVLGSCRPRRSMSSEPSRRSSTSRTRGSRRSRPARLRSLGATVRLARPVMSQGQSLGHDLRDSFQGQSLGHAAGEVARTSSGGATGCAVASTPCRDAHGRNRSRPPASTT